MHCLQVFSNIEPPCLVLSLSATKKVGGIKRSATKKVGGREVSCPRTPVNRQALNTIFQFLWYDATKEMSPRLIESETNVLATTPPRQKTQDERGVWESAK